MAITNKAKSLLAKKLNELGVVREGNFRLSHAGMSKFYVDMKIAHGHPDVLKLACRLVGESIGKDVTCVASSGYGGVPLAVAISMAYNLKLTLIRERPKKHGRRKLIDGYIPNRQDVVAVVDDVLTTGGSIAKMISALNPTGAKIASGHVIVKRGESKLKLPRLTYLLAVEDLL